MELSVKERFALLDLLPKAGDLTTMRVVQEGLGVLGFSEAEHAALQFTRSAEGGISWQSGADRKPDLPLGPVLTGLIRDELLKLASAKKLTLEHLALYERFAQTGHEGL
jgi:hypothetical protein